MNGFNFFSLKPTKPKMVSPDFGGFFVRKFSIPKNDLIFGQEQIENMFIGPTVLF